MPREVFMLFKKKFGSNRSGDATFQQNRNCILPQRQLISLILCSIFLLQCDQTGDYLRNLGEKNRRKKASALNKKDIEKWKRDLNFSRAQSLETHKRIHELVKNSSYQGQLSWRIARAYMADSRFDMASAYMNEAMKNKLPESEPGSIDYEQLLPLLEQSLRRFSVDTDLLFDAGLCYANASRARGWETRRWMAARKLFEEMLSRKPDEGRALYQLALLYGKSNNRYLDKHRAIEYLDRLLIKEDKHIPGRFARAHILVEIGELERARTEYIRIQEVLMELEKVGVISGAKKSPNYKQATSNIQKLDICISGNPGCEVR